MFLLYLRMRVRCSLILGAFLCFSALCVFGNKTVV